jgi:Chitobiase/beta-hexosaminidase C-terminal domain
LTKTNAPAVALPYAENRAFRDRRRGVLHGIIGFDFEIGAQHYNDTGSGPESCFPNQQPPFGTNTTNPCLLNEGFHEAMEFASGNYGLLHEALEYAGDTTAPDVDAVSTPPNGALVSGYEVKFVSDEAASIYYTTDGSTPTTASTEYKPPRARALPLPLELPAGTTLKWIAHDFKGNMSDVKSERFIPHVDAPGNVSGTVPATLSPTLAGPAIWSTPRSCCRSRCRRASAPARSAT